MRHDNLKLNKIIHNNNKTDKQKERTTDKQNNNYIK